MKIVLFSSDFNTLDEWKNKKNDIKTTLCSELSSLADELKIDREAFVIADYDSVAPDVNNLISAALIPQNLIVLEKAPSVVTGRMLVLRGVKAYGNSKMHATHFDKMLQTVTDGNIWTYPELTAFLVKIDNKNALSEDSRKLVENRLSDKESKVLFLILKGLTNDAIASKLKITTRTVKAHISSIFSKLHVNDRLSLALLLK
jgi:DNA-binding NarL/FixJ family response regulator